MALFLAMPLSGLHWEQFTALHEKLMKYDMEQDQNSPNSGRNSPSAESESSSGISSCAMSGESASAELTPDSTRAPTPNRQEMHESEEKENASPQIIYQGRDILNLAANIRGSLWNSIPSYHDPHYRKFAYTCSLHRLGDKHSIRKENTEICGECDFREASILDVTKKE